MPSSRFTARPEHYDRFMGRYAAPLAEAFTDAAGIGPGLRALDVGCGPGALTGELCGRLGADHVAAIDPAPQFVAACRERYPGADVRQGVAEHLPWPDATFDAALSALVIAFMSDPDAGVREMARVTRPQGTVAACMWDVAGDGMEMLHIFWSAAREVDPGVVGERRAPGTAHGDLEARFRRAGLQDVQSATLTVSTSYAGFDDFWEPLTFAVGPAGQHLASLSPQQQAHVRDAARAKVPEGPFSLQARAWCACARVPKT
jgi:ubiquinone/menaquinone biosynthesis C-methylase UbiE